MTHHTTPMAHGGQGGQQSQMGGGQSRMSGGQQGTQQTGTQSQMGGQQHQMGGGQGGQSFEDYLTGDERLVLHDVVKATHTAAWCADLCIDEGPQMASCIRLCEDVEELGSVTQEFIARDSVFAPHVVETLIEVAEECAMECEQHQHPHCQENASVLRKLVQSGTEYLQGQSGGGQMGGGQSQTGGHQSRMGGQQSQMGGGRTGGTNAPVGGSQY